MRPKERIPIVLNNIIWKDFLKYLTFDENQISDIIKLIIENYSKIEQCWNDNPDYRLGQLLVNEGYIPDNSIAFYVEETEYMIKFKQCLPEELLFWGTRGDQPLKMVSIDKMETDHLKACLETQKQMNAYYEKTMLKVINKRRKLKIKSLL